MPDSTASTPGSTPAWYSQCLEVPSATSQIDVEGVSLNYETRGETSSPGVVLIHGSNAHKEWWRFIAPLLADQFRIAAIDLSGNGDSGWRERYTGELFAREVWEAVGPRTWGSGRLWWATALAAGWRCKPRITMAMRWLG